MGIDYFEDLRTMDTENLGEKSYPIATIRGSEYKFEVKNEK